MKERTNLLVMGTLASGSGALFDMLYEYDNINVLRYEFDNYRRPGFVSDQLSVETATDYPNVIDQNIRFTNSRWEFIFRHNLWKLIPQKSLDKIWEKDYPASKLKAYKDSLTELYHNVFLQDLSRNLRSDISFDEKIQLAAEWIKKIGSTFPSRYDYTLFYQALHPWSDPLIWSRVFNPFKLIIVYREPKDQIAEMVRREIVFSPFRDSKLSFGQFNITSIYGNDRSGRIKFVTDALEKRVERIDNWQQVIEPGRILFVDFDGLVNNYDEYEAMIEQFIGNISGKHKLRHKYYNPENAKKNSLGIYRKYLTEKEQNELEPLCIWYRKMLKQFSPVLKG